MSKNVDLKLVKDLCAKTGKSETEVIKFLYGVEAVDVVKAAEELCFIVNEVLGSTPDSEAFKAGDKAQFVMDMISTLRCVYINSYGHYGDICTLANSEVKNTIFQRTHINKLKHLDEILGRLCMMNRSLYLNGILADAVETGNLKRTETVAELCFKFEKFLKRKAVLRNNRDEYVWDEEDLTEFYDSYVKIHIPYAECIKNSFFLKISSGFHNLEAMMGTSAWDDLTTLMDIYDDVFNTNCMLYIQSGLVENHAKDCKEFTRSEISGLLTKYVDEEFDSDFDDRGCDDALDKDICKFVDFAWYQIDNSAFKHNLTTLFIMDDPEIFEDWLNRKRDEILRILFENVSKSIGSINNQNIEATVYDLKRLIKGYSVAYRPVLELACDEILGNNNSGKRLECLFWDICETPTDTVMRISDKLEKVKGLVKLIDIPETNEPRTITVYDKILDIFTPEERDCIKFALEVLDQHDGRTNNIIDDVYKFFGLKFSYKRVITSVKLAEEVFKSLVDDATRYFLNNTITNSYSLDWKITDIYVRVKRTMPKIIIEWRDKKIEKSESDEALAIISDWITSKTTFVNTLESFGIRL